MIASNRIRQMGWGLALALCAGFFLAVSFQVTATRSQLQLAERELIALQRETMMLETEFEARASQRQLAQWNALEFGYQPPRADQFIDNERELAMLGAPAAPSAPRPIRLARVAEVESEATLADATLAAAGIGARLDGAGLSEPASTAAHGNQRQAMVSPLSGRQIARAQAPVGGETRFIEAFGEMLAEASPVRPAMAAQVRE